MSAAGRIDRNAAGGDNPGDRSVFAEPGGWDFRPGDAPRQRAALRPIVATVPELTPLREPRDPLGSRALTAPPTLPGAVQTRP